MHELFDRRFLFFGGKGGVGKTTAAAATAILASRTGRRVLLVSTDPAHSTADIFAQPIGPQLRRLFDGLWAQEVDPDVEADRYIQGVKDNLRKVVSADFFPEMERQVNLARQSPGAEEAALFDRVAAIVDEADAGGAGGWDLVIFDTAPTGHTLRLLALPELMQAWVDGMLRHRHKATQLKEMWVSLDGGRQPAADPVTQVLEERRRKFAKVRRLLLDPLATAFVPVLIPEKLPILETVKAVQVLEQHRIPLGALVVNRVLPAGADGEFLRRRREQEQVYLAEIDRTFRRLRRLYVPMLEQDVRGPDALGRVAAYLSGSEPGAVSAD